MTRAGARKSAFVLVACVFVPAGIIPLHAVRLYEPRIEGRWVGVLSLYNETPRPVVLDIRSDGAQLEGSFATFKDAAGTTLFGSVGGRRGTLHRAAGTGGESLRGHLTLTLDGPFENPDMPECAVEGEFTVEFIDRGFRLFWQGTRALGNCSRSVLLVATEEDHATRLASFAREVGAMRAETEPVVVPVDRVRHSPSDLEVAGALLLAGGVVFYYFFVAIALLAVAKKAGVGSRWRAWVPWLNVVLLLRAARLSPWWALAMIVPILNWAVLVLAWLEIAKHRRLQSWPAWLVWIPLVNIAVIGYYAFTPNVAAVERETDASGFSRFCTSCGAPSGVETRFCGMCGAARVTA